MTFNPENMNIPWVESPFFEKLVAERAMSAEQKDIARRYNKDGYVIIDLFSSPEDILFCDQTIAAVEPLYKGGKRLQDGWRRIPEVQTIAAHPRIFETLRMLYGREAYPFQTLNFPIGTQQKTHSDSVHFSSLPERFMCGVWVALQDVDADCGPLHYYAGSHKLPIYTMAQLGISGANSKTGITYKEIYEPFVEKLMIAQDFTKTLGILKKGQALIWSANLFHGGEPIRREGATRHSQVTHYYFVNTINYTPIRSDIETGKIHHRVSVDIRTRKLMSAQFLGEPYELPFGRRVRAFVREKIKWVKRGSETA